ncbi:MAPEG family protein [Parasphingorhabdus cellanae]|uniref:MAPEG family protein n=1 Tax=Parasphingorhabdus cellanae TaxID=2806553 RepID=A0ABX7T6A1_9SPHN|nr:MAPEG family protein [Parasphingorhabdus cellanae]QTD56302.1 MAPEG family protein [Parasphingorhabdus cellanae]
MENNLILQPVVALILWTMIMWLWMYVTRIPAMNKADIDVDNLIGGVGSDLDAVIPEKIQWKAHNYNHLLDEPTLFYAVCLVLALVSQGDGVSLAIAWAYVGLRVIHSLIQVISNRIKYRFLVFALSSLCIIALAIHAAIAVFH